MINHFLRFSLLFILFALPFKHTSGQCPNQVLHLSGSAIVGGCTEVTVTSDGSVAGNNFNGGCGFGPFWVGHSATGSFTFTFSPAISGVKLDISAIDNHLGHTEELIFEVNGSFYPISNPGIPVPQCYFPAVIWPPGVIRGQIDTVGSWMEFVIAEDMTSLKVENNWVAGFPAGVIFSLYLCCPGCTTDAGEISSGPLYLCRSDPAVVPMAEQSFLDGDDLLQYILFSNLTDTLGSIITTSNIPEFAFDPATMQTGVIYYIAAVAGNDLGGNIDLNDPCLDISNAIEVVWHALPAVYFFSLNTGICPGTCLDIEVNFTGTPPFQLSGEVISWANVISTFSESYLENTGLLTVCLPPDTELGSLEVNATELTDGFCTCD